MLQLSGFADEIAPDLPTQITVARRCGLSAIELRSIGGKNVLEFTPGELAEHKRALQDAGLRVISIGSPCGKKPVDAPEGELLGMFEKAVEAAHHFGAPLIRVFSFYPPGGEGKGDLDEIRGRVVDLMAEQARMLEGTDLTMVHENEKGIFGDVARRCLDLMKSVDSPKLRTAFDFANFVQVGENPQNAWPDLKPYTTHIHIKDAKSGTGQVVPPGEGDGGIGPILKDAHESGYGGYVSMEPHLLVAGHSHGESGPELFQLAVDRLRALCRTIGVPLEDASVGSSTGGGA